MGIYAYHLHKSTGNRWVLTRHVLNPGSNYHTFVLVKYVLYPVRYTTIEMEYGLNLYEMFTIWYAELGNTFPVDYFHLVYNNTKKRTYVYPYRTYTFFVDCGFKIC